MILTLPIHDVHSATPRAHVVRLALGGCSFDYRAGQAAFLMPEGGDRRRAYSIASAPEETARHGLLEFLVQTAEGGLSPSLLRPGNLVTVEGPLGSFSLPDQLAEQRFMFIAGGTGIAPLRSMMWEALLGNRAGRISLVYSVRTPDEFAYCGQFERLESEGRIELRRVVTRGATNGWSGAYGRIDSEGLKDLVEPGETVCFVCGPPAFTRDIPPQLKRLGVADDHIRMERW